MAFTIDQYSRKASRDARSAMAGALAEHLRGLTFFNPGPFRFQEVYDEWPAYLDRHVSPSAVVLPGTQTYEDALMSPTLCEDTVEPVNPAGQMISPGFGLYKLSELVVDFEVQFRAGSVGERDAIMLAMEGSLQIPELLMSEEGARYGLFLPLPDYYGLSARFALLSSRVVDDEERAMREQREAIFTINAQVPQVKVGPVAPLALTIVKKQRLPDGTCVDL